MTFFYFSHSPPPQLYVWLGGGVCVWGWIVAFAAVAGLLGIANIEPKDCCAEYSVRKNAIASYVSVQPISYCPWCGTKLKSDEDLAFDEALKGILKERGSIHASMVEPMRSMFDAGIEFVSTLPTSSQPPVQ